MNYLAHLCLAGENDDVRLGSLLGDFLKGNLERYRTDYNPQIWAGVRLHREADRFTDSHAIFLRSRQRLNSDYRRVSGILVDIFYDHFLSRNWDLFFAEPLPEFIDRVYRMLEQNLDAIPQKLRGRVPVMIAENWLGSYGAIAGVELTLTRLSRRFKRPTNLATATAELIDNYQGLEADFLLFFPEAINHMENLLKGYHCRII
ncbi:MAG: ACP phosphodiesterase [Limnospira sp.]